MLGEYQEGPLFSSPFTPVDIKTWGENYEIEFLILEERLKENVCTFFRYVHRIQELTRSIEKTCTSSKHGSTCMARIAIEADIQRCLGFIEYTKNYAEYLLSKLPKENAICMAQQIQVTLDQLNYFSATISELQNVLSHLKTGFIDDVVRDTIRSCLLVINGIDSLQMASGKDN